ncbi:metallophosphoesterase family protein [Pseudophaeobacter flagellatus]|uniref:metallophosphoesterase family protein n=1 Tax=Pseudophaeobacter flagellatus TaxID=2899119 RepID=UPI001E3DB649|nr:DNA repair exonuclease [Pseudophaeobacter flagellatus]MCD9149947.1 DNA repair exonuclease [Pseudophaeobacter flagellatus]
MTPFRFLHTSDLHLGKRFGQMPEETRADLQQARQQSVVGLARVAQAQRAGHVLIAGDLFDSETPSDRVLRQALAGMAAATDLQWWIIPGNHDSAAAETLWTAMAEHAGENTHLLMQPDPVQMAPGVQLLPAPCRHRFAGQDLTAWMDGQATPEGDLRIGLAHGGVLEFGSEEAGGEVISAQRASSARLDYLALGDWHGTFTLNARSRYSGTPEADRFKHAGAGQCLLVELTTPGAEPKVTFIETGTYHWQEQPLVLTPAADIAAEMRALLPEPRADWHHHLLRLRAEGWVTPPQLLALRRAVAEVAPEFCYFQLDEAGLRSQHQVSDLDLIASNGALRAAAEELMQAAQDGTLAQAERDTASAALNRLFAYTQDAATAEDPR